MLLVVIVVLLLSSGISCIEVCGVVSDEVAGAGSISCTYLMGTTQTS
jgi:hypothetical protein